MSYATRFVAALACLFSSSTFSAELLLNGGTTVSGVITWDRNAFVVKGKGSHSPDSVVEVRYSAVAERVDNAALITLTDGTIFAGNVPSSSTTGTLRLVLKSGQTLQLKDDDVQAIEFQQARSSKIPELKPLSGDHAHIVLVNGTVETGRVTYFTPQIIGATMGGRRERFRKDTVAKIVFRNEKAQRSKVPMILRSVFGDVLPGELKTLDEASVRFKTSAGVVTLSTDHLFSIETANPSVSYLSELKPKSRKTESYLDVVHKPTFNHDLFGNPLRYGQLTFRKGVAMHSCTSLRYDLKNKYTLFTVAVHMDDRYSEFGHAKLLILVDGKQQKSLSLEHGGALQYVDVSVTGAGNFEIVLDYGKFGSSGDFALLLNSRLVSR